MNFAGFYPCAVAGAIDRIFGIDQAIGSLTDVSEAAMIEKYQVFCRLCGYYWPIKEPSCDLVSAAWRVALERYQVRQTGYKGAMQSPLKAKSGKL